MVQAPVVPVLKLPVDLPLVDHLLVLDPVPDPVLKLPVDLHLVATS